MNKWFLVARILVEFTFSEHTLPANSLDILLPYIRVSSTRLRKNYGLGMTVAFGTYGRSPGLIISVIWLVGIPHNAQIEFRSSPNCHDTVLERDFSSTKTLIREHVWRFFFDQPRFRLRMTDMAF